MAGVLLLDAEPVIDLEEVGEEQRLHSFITTHEGQQAFQTEITLRLRSEFPICFSNLQGG